MIFLGECPYYWIDTDTGQGPRAGEGDTKQGTSYIVLQIVLAQLDCKIVFLTVRNVVY